MKTHAPIYNPSFFFPLSVFFSHDFWVSSSFVTRPLSVSACHRARKYLLSRQHFRWFLVLYKYSFTPSFLEFAITIQSSINGSRILSTTSLAVVLKLYNEIDEIRHDDIRNIYLYLLYIYFFIYLIVLYMSK